jgi:protoheme IX farnesyltransferase
MKLLLYIELFKLRIGVLLVLTAALGYASAIESIEGIDLNRLSVLAIAMLLCSSGSSVFNHFYDRDIDRLMERTKIRPLASGDIKNPYYALFMGIILLLAGLSISLLMLNYMVALYLFLGSFTYMVVYTIWLKRRHWINIVIGGAAGSFPVLAGAAASESGVIILPILMSIILFLWTPSHFWALALILKDDYAKAGIPMLPVLVGNRKCAQYMMVNTVLLVVSAFTPFLLGELGLVYLLISTIVGIRFLWLNWTLCSNPNEGPAWKTFFFSMIYLSCIVAGVFIDRALLLQY